MRCRISRKYTKSPKITNQPKNLNTLTMRLKFVRDDANEEWMKKGEKKTYTTKKISNVRNQRHHRHTTQTRARQRHGAGRRADTNKKRKILKHRTHRTKLSAFLFRRFVRFISTSIYIRVCSLLRCCRCRFSPSISLQRYTLWQNWSTAHSCHPAIPPSPQPSC